MGQYIQFFLFVIYVGVVKKVPKMIIVSKIWLNNKFEYILAYAWTFSKYAYTLVHIDMYNNPCTYAYILVYIDIYNDSCSYAYILLIDIQYICIYTNIYRYAGR